MRRTIVTIAVLAMIVTYGGCSTEQGEQSEASPEHAAVHWGYERDNGPAHWGEMNADWSTCSSGQSQSPIDLGSAEPGEILATNMEFPPVDLQVLHQEHVLDALDNGHTIQVNYDGGETLSFGDQAYKLLQYHFHSPSEHTVDGEHYPMEMHLVHKADSGELAVIGVFVEEGDHHPAFDAVWQNLPQKKGDQVHLDGVQVDIDDMLPHSRTSYRYHGSLTTPPCSEGVRWILMTEPIQLDAVQINTFRDVFSGNNRPPQALNGREVLTDEIR